MPTRKRTTRRATSRRKTVVRKSASTRRVRKVNRQWSREEVAFMRQYYRKFETAWCARQMGRTVYSVRYKAVDLGLKKSNPSVWRGNKGSATAFKACSKGRKTVARKTKATRSTAKRTWRASSKRRTMRKAAPRRRTARKAMPRRRTRR